ncbi:unnamed protein product [Cuscuta epithymum]|uniref:Reverse transcriptase domain-containing protein n=1 Tax=Cuscuta epithymum TaxID=186058 RepID=A0AAV0G6Z7_9ASTE|nr:unnamed protein product [Cuscuta epithymum]
MSILSWNCRGLGNAATVQSVVDIVQQHRPSILFLMETKVRCQRAKEVIRAQGFIHSCGADSAGQSGGLVLGWTDDIDISVFDIQPTFIDAMVKLTPAEIPWRLTCYYGFPETVRKREAWALLRDLADRQQGPWMVIGDFNDILYDSEKKGRIQQPRWRLRGFQECVLACGLRDFPFSGYQWTWGKSLGMAYWVEAKLDRIMVNDEWWNRFMAAQASSVEAPVSDNMALSMSIMPTIHGRKKKSFKFENKWLKEEECRTVVASSWCAGTHLTVPEKIYFCGNELLRWDACKKRGFRHQIIACKRRIAWLRGRVDRNSIAEFLRQRATLYALMEKENEYWRQRAKEFWLKEGDINSRYFHNAVKQRRRRNKIVGLKAVGGEWITDRKKVGDMVTDYFLTIFQAQQGEEILREVDFRKQVKPSQNTILLRPISPEEVKRAVFDMHPDKAPGSDGMNPAFFQAYWDIVGPEVAQLVSGIFESGSLPKELNVTNLVLIPNKDKPENMGDWRPIALCNVVYKIFSKVLANRLKRILNDLVDDNQSAFIPGRSIINNVVVAFETHHYLKRKSSGKEGYVAMKLDMSKAYDRVSWRFLEA